jgi:hypothetical protein
MYCLNEESSPCLVTQRKRYSGKRKSTNATKLQKGVGSSILAAIFILSSVSSPQGATAFSVQKTPNANSIHRIVFGTAALSKAEDPHGMLDAAFEKGVRRFDLARTYGMGESERIFGEWLQSRDINRRDIDLITKGGIGMDKYGDPDRPLLTRDNLKEEVSLSLRTLNVEDVDLYMFHRDDARLSVGKHVEWINEIVKTGKIKRWGVSNWSFERFQAAHMYAVENNLVPPSANSPQYSLAAPVCDVWPSTQSISQPNHSMEIEWYADNGIELLCWEGKIRCSLLSTSFRAYLTEFTFPLQQSLQKVSWLRVTYGLNMRLTHPLLMILSKEDLTSGACNAFKKLTVTQKTIDAEIWLSDLPERVTLHSHRSLCSIPLPKVAILVSYSALQSLTILMIW